MRDKILAALACSILFACCARATGAQEVGADTSASGGAASPRQTDTTRSPYDLEKGTYEFGVWGGGSFDSTTFFARSPDRKLVITGLRVGRVMGAKKHFTFEWTVDVVPYVRLVQPRDVRPFGTDGGVIVARSTGDANGFGLSPIGPKFLFRRRERVKPFVGGTAGFLYFDRAVPYDAARRFNFTFDGTAGVQIFSRTRLATTLGYKFHHISNAGTRDVNPGVDSHVFYAGFSVFR